MKTRRFRVTWNQYETHHGTMQVWYGWLVCSARRGNRAVWTITLDGIPRAQVFTRGDIAELFSDGITCGKAVNWLEM